MFKLVKLQVETASGGTEAEVSLVAITQAEAERIQQALFERKKAAEDTGTDVPVPLEETAEEAEEAEEPVMMYKMTGQELLTAASTSSGIGVIISGVFAFSLKSMISLIWIGCMTALLFEQRRCRRHRIGRLCCPFHRMAAQHRRDAFEICEFYCRA